MNLSKITKFFIKAGAFVILLFCCKTGSATHLVGGYITYTHLSDSLYEVKLRIYRDCNDGNFAFRDSSEITFVDQNFVEIFSRYFQKGPTVPLNLIIDSCTFVPPGVCVEYADYIDTVSLPPIPGGYTIYHTECCRNQLIINLPTPLSTSYAYVINSPGLASIGNTSPQMVSEPPVFLCQNEPLNLRLETYEPDGDSLHFELCDIMKSQPGIPPYISIPFSGNYSSQYPMDASPPFAIDSQTGQITGTPNTIGHYVLGICIREYRDGIPLSTVRFDYQFNVTNCVIVKSDMLTQQEDSLLWCNGLTVKFTDESTNAQQVFWDFGDTTTLADTSMLRNPSYTYPAPGIYSVRLIAKYGTQCADTVTEVFVVQNPLPVSFINERNYCFSEQPLSMFAQGSYPAQASYKWDFGPGASYATSSLKEPPPVAWAAPGKYYVKLSVIQGSCISSHGDTVVINPEPKSQMILPADNPDMTCNGLTVPFVSKSRNATSVFWDFGDTSSTADTSTLGSALYTFPKAGFYEITLIAFQDTLCTDTTVYTIEVHEALKPEFATGGQSCFEGQDLAFNALGTYPQGTEFTWSFGPLAEVQVAKGPGVSGISWKQPGTYPVKLMVEKGFCKEEIFDTVEIEALSVLVDAGDTQRVKEGALFYLNATSNARDFYWYCDQPADISSRFSSTTSVNLAVQDIDSIVKFYVKVTDYWGCEGLDSTYVIFDLDESNRIYNAISPNNDGVNDYLDLSGFMRGHDCKLTIMNRWGSEVYHADQYANDWNGIDNQGRDLPDGTYYYIVYCTPSVRAIGPITIVRSAMN